MLCRGKTQTTACQSANGGIGFASRYDVEWPEPDIIDAEVSRLVNGAISGKNPRRWRSSTSSGYSSHSPPLSAGSYSTCCASVLRSSGTGTIADVGLAVIHEAEIPRPIWPCNGGNRDCNFDGHEESLCKYCGYARIYSYPAKYRTSCRHCAASKASAKDVLLELSRTLNSVIDGANTMTAEEVLRDISKTVANGIQANVTDDHVYRYPSTLSSGVAKESVNPVNLRLYGKSGWANPTSPKSSQFYYDSKTCPAVFLVPRCHAICSRGVVGCSGKSVKGVNGPSRGKEESKRKRGVSRLEGNTVKGCYPSNEPVYSTLDPSDESSSYGALGEPPKKTTWNEGITVFNKSLDFTLDGARAERLGRTIARAKRRRQWCRALTTLFGLVFFILSVIVVSMSVTKGRKIFGSM
ncbi:uncharacterized protein LOC135164710 [Diachasmimorpha longicaudata]|uniref:uncharacterized protein LOC135164710 n=1 Tax=Diachasmimorpha longicaudata TaxID=58733 RepID=UPI0030B87B97